MGLPSMAGCSAATRDRAPPASPISNAMCDVAFGALGNPAPIVHANALRRPLKSYREIGSGAINRHQEHGSEPSIFPLHLCDGEFPMRENSTVAYRYQLQDLFRLLGPNPVATKALVANHRRVQHGLLSVGLKIHCLDDGRQFDRLIAGLGGAAEVLRNNRYKNERASLCFVLPPVGSANSAVQLMECLEQFIGSQLFGNPHIQLQLCSPGRLSSRSSALLGIAFYLGSDTLRRYTQADLRTTFSADYSFPRGMRLVLYDAEGEFDRNFVWWNHQPNCDPTRPLGV